MKVRDVLEWIVAMLYLFVLLIVLPLIPLVLLVIFLQPATFWQKFVVIVFGAVLYFIVTSVEFSILTD